MIASRREAYSRQEAPPDLGPLRGFARVVVQVSPA